ncbi:hypothetical protein P3X46_014151 [Hevea brasiliensis]|uniref:Leucine-rich repeat-containing N-terminal plant-type domain-containing protein n=1 Tax=Hevea brasiliensis TaxID=3981 RepID=A0ABQ9M868_HEVBR|nr:hypothetical protein P3X46_014151 [Hevea brasiliensis]
MAKLSFLFEPFSIFFFVARSLCCPPYQKEALRHFKFLLLGNSSFPYSSSSPVLFVVLLYQKEALRHFKFLLLGNSSSISNMELYGNDNFTSDCCQWGLVGCTSQKVTHLHLSGLIPSLDLKKVVTSDVLAPLFHLQTLISLDISKNDIHGEILRVGFANISSLEYLDMDGNSFNGSLPPHLFSLWHLATINLDYNLIHGSIPTQIGNLSNLVAMSLYSNKISGAIPPSLFHLKRLGFLNLGRNFLNMELPAETGNLSNIEYLFLDNNNLSGEIPSSIRKMEQLKCLDLGDKFVIISLDQFLHPSQICLNWVLLDSSSNRFSGNKFPIFNQNSSLLYMDLSSNKLSGQVPTTFPLGIKVLVLSQNEFSHVLPQNLSNFNQLYYLDLRGNNIGGEIPNFLSQMSSLQMLNFRNNSFEGSISINLSSLSALQILDLSCNNNLSGIIPHTLGNLSGMVNHHDFSSSISSSIISQINIFPNTGFLIHAITVANQTVLLLRSLEVFWKKSKRSLPNKNLQLYAFFDLSNNQLSGEIPDSLGGLKNLKSVNLSQNKFFGRIPLSFGDLESLESLDLSHNNLFGEIPYTLANLFELSYLDLSKNKLEGCIPGVSCGKLPSEPKLKDGKLKKSKSWETWFSWEMAVIGYPSSFLSTVFVMYVIGYFNIIPQPSRRRRRRCLVRHGHFGF